MLQMHGRMPCKAGERALHKARAYTSGADGCEAGDIVLFVWIQKAARQAPTVVSSYSSLVLICFLRGFFRGAAAVLPSQNRDMRMIKAG